VPREPGAVRARGLNTDPHERPEAAHPAKQRPVSRPGRRESLGPQHISAAVHHGGIVQILMGVHAPRYLARGHACHTVHAGSFRARLDDRR